MTVDNCMITLVSILCLLCSLFKNILFNGSSGVKLLLVEIKFKCLISYVRLRLIHLLVQEGNNIKHIVLSLSVIGHFFASLNEFRKISFRSLVSIIDSKGLICLFKPKRRSIILALPSIIVSQSGTIEAPLMFESNDLIDYKIIHPTNRSAALVNSYNNINKSKNFILSNEEERLTRPGKKFQFSKKLGNKNAPFNNPLSKFEDSSRYNLDIKGSSSSTEEEEEILASKSQEGLRETNYLSPHLSRSETDSKKKVRFSFVKMEAGDLNFRVTLSIKNEANGQQVYYKVDKNRFRKEKTIKLMVETLYRIDISFKPTQTLARAIVNGHEVKMTERVHDHTASAYSLHLPTSNVQPTPKGQREEISFLIQLTNGLVLQTSLQTKFYKLSDTQRCEWGSTFHCIEYDCESYSESATIAVIRETFR